MATIRPEDFERVFSEGLKLYSKEITDDIKAETENQAKEAVSSLKKTSPVGRRRKYAKSWKQKKSFENANDIRFTVYNTQYQLEHLLEKGHKISRAGKIVGSARAKPHIKAAEEEMTKNFGKAVELIIGKNK